MSILEVLIGFLALTASWFLVKWWRFWSSVPPGPWGLPFVGYLFKLSPNLHMDFVELGKKYGDVFSLNLCGNLYVILNSAEAVHDAFGKRDDFSSRSVNDILVCVADIEKDIFGAPYTEQRRMNKKFILQAMRGFAYGASSSEAKVLEETRILQEYLVSKKAEGVDIKAVLPKVCLNVILSIMMGARYDWEDPWSVRLLTLFHNFFAVFVEGYVSLRMEFMPRLANIVYKQRITKMRKAKDEFHKILMDHIEERCATFDPAFTRDILDIYIREGKLDEIGKKGLADTIFILLPDAIETNTIILSWTLLYVTMYPDVQRRIHKELDDVIGQEKELSYKDRLKLPFTEAAIYEAIRVSNSVTLSVSHKPEKDTTFRGYYIPESATIVGNIYAIHTNSEAFPEPQAYKPERLLGEENLKNKRENFIPFGVGRRMCMGEPLARMENFLIFASLMQKFSFAFPSNESPPSVEAASAGMVLYPQDFKLVATPR